LKTDPIIQMIGNFCRPTYMAGIQKLPTERTLKKSMYGGLLWKVGFSSPEPAPSRKLSAFQARKNPTFKNDVSKRCTPIYPVQEKKKKNSEKN